MPADWTEERYAREVIQKFAEHAFRDTPPAPDYIDRLVGLFQANRTEGQTIDTALLQPLSIVLSSPSFLYMVESTGHERLTDTELAVRLSYFLWSSPPDQQLMDLARAGQLSQPEVLSEQTSRLLADDRADQFIKDFAHQWLEMDRLGIFPFDSVQYQDFDNAVLYQSGEEIIHTLRYSLDHRLPIQGLIKSDFVVIDEVMADFYGLPDTGDHDFQRIDLPGDSTRGGLLSSAAVLAMGSDGNRTSPVERGAWVLRHILNDPPPPAPPNVPQLDRLDDEIRSSRELGVAHQEEAQCVQCHRKIDPIGYAMEHFNAAGLWRETEVVHYGKKGKETKSFPIDTTGELVDGTPIADFDSLRDYIAGRSDDFARGFTEAIIAYGLGRPYGFSDHDLAESLLKQSQSSGYAMADVIHALVESTAFQTK